MLTRKGDRARLNTTDRPAAFRIENLGLGPCAGQPADRTTLSACGPSRRRHRPWATTGRPDAGGKVLRISPSAGGNLLGNHTRPHRGLGPKDETEAGSPREDAHVLQPGFE